MLARAIASTIRFHYGSVIAQNACRSLLAQLLFVACISFFFAWGNQNLDATQINSRTNTDQRKPNASPMYISICKMRKNNIFIRSVAEVFAFVNPDSPTTFACPRVFRFFVFLVVLTSKLYLSVNHGFRVFVETFFWARLSFALKVATVLRFRIYWVSRLILPIMVYQNLFSLQNMQVLRGSLPFGGACEGSATMEWD